jgi:Popeye protein conserved region
MDNPIVWITVANVIYLVSYSVRDILWLRVLTVVAAGLLIPYYMMQVVPLRAAIGWNVVFIAINCYWIVRLLIERRPVHFTPDEARLRVLSFPSLTAREARDLFAMGAWDSIAADTSLVTHDRDQGRFSVILRGLADVIYRGEKISELGEGQFVGEIDLHADIVGDMDVLMRTAARVMCWPRDRLRAFAAKRPDVALALERSVGFELQHVLDTTLTKIGAPEKPQRE